MDLIILGLLMIHNCTIYEMKKVIEINLTNVSSNSTGSIQVAVKKLLGKNMICFTECVENSVNRKVYEITTEGKNYFLSSISKPMLYKEKNMELGKLFFMGFAEKNKRTALIDSYIMELEKELSSLKQIKSVADAQSNFDENYLAMLKEKGNSTELTLEDIVEIAFFQYALLDLSISKIEFEIQWFENFKQTVQKN